MHISHRAGTIEMEGKLAPSLPCRVCGKQVSGPDRQTHMGRHIYLALHVGHDDSATKSSVSDKVMKIFFCLSTLHSGVKTLSVRILWWSITNRAARRLHCCVWRAKNRRFDMPVSSPLHDQACRKHVALEALHQHAHAM